MNNSQAEGDVETLGTQKCSKGKAKSIKDTSIST